MKDSRSCNCCVVLCLWERDIFFFLQLLSVASNLLIPGPDYPQTGLGECPGAPANRGAPSD